MVSIIMPAYNAEKTILESIGSVIGQSFTDWELIVVDDCSQDGTVEIVETLIKKQSEHVEFKATLRNGTSREDIEVQQDSKVMYRGQNDLRNETDQIEITDPTEITKQMHINRIFGKSVYSKNCNPKIRLLRNTENRGVAFSRNRGVEAAGGDWIAFLDSDDLWTSDKLEKQLKYVKDHDLKEGLVFTASSFINEDGKKLDHILHVPGQIDRRELLKQNVISCSSVLVSKNLIRKNKFPENIKTIHEDFVVWLEILGESFCSIDVNTNNESYSAHSEKTNICDVVGYEKKTVNTHTTEEKRVKSQTSVNEMAKKSYTSDKSVRVAYGIDEPLLIYRIAAGSKSGKKSKAAIMNWNTYRYVGLNFVESAYYMIHYSIRGALKWMKIKKSRHGEPG